MLTVIAEHLKLHRHQLGQTALFVGSGVVLPPWERRVDELLEELAREHVGERVQDWAPEQRGPAAIEEWAKELPDHAARCAILKERLAEARPAEGHIRLARLIRDGYFPTIFLAEPDRLLEQALASHHMEPEKDYHHFVVGLDDAETIAVGVRDSARLVIVKCAGDVESKYLPLSRAEIEAGYAQIDEIIRETFKVFSLIVAYTDRDEAFLRHISREGGKIFWINRYVPMRDEALYDELKIENPASIEYHRFQPEVMALLEARHSARHLLCREAGTFNEFFGKLHGRLSRVPHRHHRTATERRRDLALLRSGPYRFLDAFDVTDGDLFFGREEDVEAVLELLRQQPLSILFGPSGVGKTSLIRAGLVPALQREAEEVSDPAEAWLPVVAGCQDDPAANVREALAAALEEIGFAPEGLPRRGRLVEFLQAAHALCKRRLALFLDHFEEFFVHLGPRMQQAFLEELVACLQEMPAAHWLLAIREDYVGQLYELQPQLPEILHHMYRLHRLTRAQAEDAIVKPAQNFDVRVEPQLVEALLDDLYREGIEPAELQIVCHRLYEAKPRGMYTITLSLYQRLGGAQKILAEFVDHLLAQLSPNERRLARAILKLMVTSSEVRVTRTSERIAADLGEDREAVERVLARLVDLRLIRAVGKERERQYELIHEYLAEEISQWLTRREMALQDVQDLLTRQLNNYQKFGILMHADELRIINEYRDALSISPEELELILRSAAVEQSETEYWFGRLGELGDRQVPLVQSLLEDARPEIRLTAARAAARFPRREYLPQLVELLDDEHPGVREAAEEALRAQERELILELRRSTGRRRSLAARAVGKLKLRRGWRYLYEALQDGDRALRDEITEALIALNEPRVHEPLLRQLTGPHGLPWAGAYALGRLATQEEVRQALEEAAQQYPELAKVHYALGIAALERRDYEAAAQHLRQAAALNRTEEGRQAIAEAWEEIEAQQERVVTGEALWPMFHRGADHCGAVATELRPPLRIVWTYPAKGPIIGSPVVAEGVVFVGSRDGNLYAIDAKRGTENWYLRTGDRIESTPAVAGRAVIIGSYDGKVYAAARESGRRLWQRDVGSPVRSSATVVGGRVFIGNRQGQLLALRADTGEVLWEARTAAEISAAPASQDGLVIVGSWDGRIYAWSSENGAKVWERPTEGPVASSPAIAEGIVYCGSDDGCLYALREANGEIQWRAELGSQIRSSPAVAAQRIVIGCVDGRIVCLSAEDGRLLWAAQSAEEVLASAAITGNIVYIGSKDGTLYSFALDSGELLWQHRTAYGIYSSPAVAEGMLYMGLDYYNLTALVPE